MLCAWVPLSVRTGRGVGQGPGGVWVVGSAATGACLVCTCLVSVGQGNAGYGRETGRTLGP